MNKKMMSLIIAFLLLFGVGVAQTEISVKASNNKIGESLNLKAVATLFEKSKNLEDFEARLNNPKYHISNVDLGKDGYVDYIRVVPHKVGNMYKIVLQAVVGPNKYVKLATIEVTKENSGSINFIVIGNPHYYGPNYIIRPAFERPPVIFHIFWNPTVRLWVSPYHWGYYPRFFHPWRPVKVVVYHRHVRRFVRAPHWYR